MEKISSDFLNNNLLKNISQPTLFFQELYSIRKNEKLLIEVTKSLVSNHRLDICDLAIKAIKLEGNSFNIADILNKTIPNLTLNINSLIVLFETLHDSMQNDLASSKQYSLVEILAEFQPKLTVNIFKKLLDVNKPFVVNYLARILITQSKVSTNSTYNKITPYLKNKSTNVKQATIIALGNLDYSLPKFKKRIADTIRLLKLESLQNNTDIDLAIISAYNNLIKYSDNVKEEFLQYSLYEIPSIKYQISFSLSLQRNCSSEKWYLDCLSNLKKVDIAHKGIIRNLDVILSELFAFGNTTYAIDYIIDWIIINKYVKNDVDDITKLFPTLFQLIFQKEKLLGNMITRLLLFENLHAHLAISDITQKLKLQNITKVSLDVETLNTISHDEIIYVVRKILGFIFDREIISNLVLSICYIDDYTETTKELIFEVFLDYIGRDYLHSTIKFLEELNDSNERVKEIVSSLLPILNKRQHVINDLNVLNEFEPSILRKRSLAKERQKIIYSSLKDVEKHSIFMQLSTNIPLKYGTGWFSFYNGGFAPPSYMTQISHSVEVPLSSMTQTISDSLQRGMFRLASRDNK